MFRSIAMPAALALALLAAPAAAQDASSLTLEVPLFATKEKNGVTTYKPLKLSKGGATVTVRFYDGEPAGATPVHTTDVFIAAKVPGAPFAPGNQPQPDKVAGRALVTLSDLPSDLLTRNLFITTQAVTDKFAFAESPARPLGLGGVTEGRDLNPRSITLADVDGLTIAHGAAAGAVLTSDSSGRGTWMQLGTAGLGDGSVTGAKIADQTITSADIAEATIGQTHLADGAVATSELTNGAVTLQKLGLDAVDGARVVDGSLSGADLAEATLGQFHLADGAVATSELTNGAVTLQKLGLDAVDGARVVDGSLSGADLAGATLGQFHLADGAVATSELTDGAVTLPKLGLDAVDGARVMDGSLSGADLGEGTLGQFHLADGSVATSELTDGAVTTPKLGLDAVDGARVMDGSLSGLDIADRSITHLDLSEGAVGQFELGTGSVATSELTNAAVTQSKIASNAVDSARIVDNSITSSDIANGTITASDRVGSGNQQSGPNSFVGGGFQNHASGYDSVVAGGVLNHARSNQSVVAGGRENIAGFTDGSGEIGDFVGGGQKNEANSNAWAGDYPAAFVGGGKLNKATNAGATIGGGENNQASAFFSAILGGQNNSALAASTVVSGGRDNHAGGAYSAIAGGLGNRTEGRYSFAAGRRASALHDGAFVWGDASEGEKPSLEPNSFTVYAEGGTRFYSDRQAEAGVGLAPGAGSWSQLSDEASKENIAPVDPRAVLAKLLAVPVATWNYRTQDDGVVHMGPMAQDFHAAFELGVDERHIDSVDPDGVAFAAIQGLSGVVVDELARKDAEIAALRAELHGLEARLQALAEVFAAAVTR